MARRVERYSSSTQQVFASSLSGNDGGGKTPTLRHPPSPSSSSLCNSYSPLIDLHARIRQSWLLYLRPRRRPRRQNTWFPLFTFESSTLLIQVRTLRQALSGPRTDSTARRNRRLLPGGLDARASAPHRRRTGPLHPVPSLFRLFQLFPLPRSSSSPLRHPAPPRLQRRRPHLRLRTRQRPQRASFTFLLPTSLPWPKVAAGSSPTSSTRSRAS